MRRLLIFLAFFVNSGLVGALGAAERNGPVRIGVLTEGFGPTQGAVGLRDGLKEVGYREEKDFVIGVRFTQGDALALPAAARELIQRRVDILFTTGRDTARAAQTETTKVPIVFAGGGDPVGQGLIQSFARPGGNVTGVTDLDLERTVRTEDEAKSTLTKVKKSDMHGILSPRSMTSNIPGYVREAGSQSSMPTMFGATFFAENGGLASYTPDTYESGRMAARLVDKILKGESPAVIPVEVNHKIELVINLKVAKALRIKIAPDVLSRANRVIR